MGAECADNTAFHRSHPVLPCRGHQGRKTGRRQKVSCIYGARLAAHIHHHPCPARAIRPYGALPRSLLITDCRKKARRRAKSKNNNNWKMEEQSRAWWKFELGTKIGGRGGWNGWLEDFPSFLEESQFGADWIGPAGLALGVRCPLWEISSMGNRTCNILPPFSGLIPYSSATIVLGLKTFCTSTVFKIYHLQVPFRIVHEEIKCK